MSLAIGSRVDRYRIEAAVGAGSMGDVFRALDVDLNRSVALKILSVRHRDNKELHARFMREGRAVAAISHPNVVQVFSTGVHDERPYIAMEFLRGVDLGTHIEQRGAMLGANAAKVVAQAANGLRAAAQAGLIHRDVKPSNLVLLEDGQLKVTDFGLAKPANPSDEPALTAMGVVVGTPDYIAPEQARGDAIDHRVDIYALGGTLYFLLTAMPPFRKGNPEDDKYLKVVARHLKDPVPDPRQRNPQIDGQLAELTMRLMAKRASDRPSYDELIVHITNIESRLSDPSQVDLPSPYQDPPVAARSQPTPFIGGDHRLASVAGDPARAPTAHSQIDDAASTLIHPKSIPPGASLPHDGRRPSTDAPLTLPPENGAAPAPPTPVPPGPASSPQTIPPGPASYPPSTIPPGPASQPPTQGYLRDSQASFSATPQPRRRATWLVVLTVLSVLTFLAGFALVLFGPEKVDPVRQTKKSTPDPVAGRDAGPLVDAPAPVPEAPSGMVLIYKGSKPWFFVDVAPVTHGDFSSLFPRHRKPSKKLRAKPVRRVSYAYAEMYAHSKKRRLPTVDELQAALATDGLGIVSDKTKVEWAQSPGEGQSASVVGRTDSAWPGAGSRPRRGAEHIIFRTVSDISR